MSRKRTTWPSSTTYLSVLLALCSFAVWGCRSVPPEMSATASTASDSTAGPAESMWFDSALAKSDLGILGTDGCVIGIRPAGSPPMALILVLHREVRGAMLGIAVEAIRLDTFKTGKLVLGSAKNVDDKMPDQTVGTEGRVEVLFKPTGSKFVAAFPEFIITDYPAKSVGGHAIKVEAIDDKVAKTVRIQFTYKGLQSSFFIREP